MTWSKNDISLLKENARKLSAKDLGKLLDKTPNSIAHKLSRLKIRISPKIRPTKFCVVCGKNIPPRYHSRMYSQPQYAHKQYCSKTCSSKARIGTPHMTNFQKAGNKATTGVPSWNKDKPWSEEIKNKMSKIKTEFLAKHPEVMIQMSKRSKEYYQEHPEAKRRLLEISKKSRKPYLYSDRREWVRSKGEQEIANWLFRNKINYVYEADLENSLYVPDFYLPNYNIYIEFYGFGKAFGYEPRTKDKQEFYKKNNIPIIEIFYKDFRRKKIPQILEKALK